MTNGCLEFFWINKLKLLTFRNHVADDEYLLLYTSVPFLASDTFLMTFPDTKGPLRTHAANTRLTNSIARWA